MPETVIRLKKPHPAQLAIQREAKRFNVVCCGRRFGKSDSAINGPMARVSLGGGPVGYFAPTYKTMKPVYDEALSRLRPVIKRASETAKIIELTTGGSVEFWTLEDPDAGRSRKYQVVVIDEAAMVPDLLAIWGQAIYPTLTDLRGSAWFLSTPKGLNGFHKLFLRGRDSAAYPDWACWQVPTSANPYIHPSEIEAARRELPDRVFRQEYLAEFIDESGGFFQNVLACVTGGATEPVGTVCLGVDLARKQDFTVITGIDSAGNQVFFQRFNDVSWSRQLEWIAAAAALFPSCKILMDATGVGDPIVEACRARNLNVEPYIFTATSKENLVNNLAMMMEQAKLSLRDEPVQTGELQSFEVQVSKAGGMRYSAPAGMHDDTVMALALAAWGQRRPSEIFFGVA